MTTRAGRATAAVGMAVALALTLVVTGCSSAASHAGTTTAPPTTVPRPVGVRPSTGCHGTPPPGTTRGTLTVGGQRRTYLITVPKATAPAPLVLLFHGFASSAEKFSDLTQLPQRAVARGMVTVAPDGTGHTWGAPDPAFITALLHHVEQSTCVDLHRVFLTGFSAGAAFTISYGCKHPDEIAAMAPVAVDFLLGCTRPTSILVFHGTADPLVAYPAGGEGQSLPGVKVAGTPADMAAWARLGRCHPTPTTRRVGSQVTHFAWTGCAGATEVGLYRIDGGGHTWPGADPSKAIGLTTQQVSATDQILAFFARHRLGD
jgi:polyhydroxybutyrate depolymerase